MRGTIGYVNGGDAIIVETSPERFAELNRVAIQRNRECRERGIPLNKYSREPQEVIEVRGWMGEDAISWLLFGQLPELVVYSGSDHGRDLSLADGRSVQIKTRGMSHYGLPFNCEKRFSTDVAILAVSLRDLDLEVFSRDRTVAIIGWVTPEVFKEHSRPAPWGARTQTRVLEQHELREYGHLMLSGICSELPRHGLFVMQAEDLR